MKTRAIAIALIIAATLTACGESKQPELTAADKQKMFNTLEDARSQARENALWNAKLYAAESPRLDGLKIVSHGDSTQTAECLSGDGWATVSFMNVTTDESTNKKKVEKYVAKCSTVSQALGCYLEQDFAKKPFAAQENHCDTSLPFPLPKVAK